jgi:hypothetical protein
MAFQLEPPMSIRRRNAVHDAAQLPVPLADIVAGYAQLDDAGKMAILLANRPHRELCVTLCRHIPWRISIKWIKEYSSVNCRYRWYNVWVDNYPATFTVPFDALLPNGQSAPEWVTKKEPWVETIWPAYRDTMRGWLHGIDE